ncbi:HAMP domain-containing protein, partial [Candidatus Poribacteria bacterium]|nr:HAMP domain-containing protein [Candidatus Poribacteria bacterium]
MLLKSRYIVVVNLVILTTMAAFFLVDDFRLRKSHIDATVQGAVAGVRARGIADTVARDIGDLVHPDETLSTVRREFRGMAKDPALQRDVLDVRLALSLKVPKVFASFSGEAEELERMTGRGTFLTLSDEELSEIDTIITGLGVIDSFGVGQVSQMVIRLVPYRGSWATRILIPYAWAVHPVQEEDAATANEVVNAVTDVGLIEIVLDSGGVAGYWRDYRLVHLLFIVLMAITLTFFIDMTTDRMVLRPLERLTDIITRAERGEVDTSEPFPQNEVGRVSATLTHMLATMQRLHGERVEALGRLAGGVAHEIRNPLNAISMSAQYLKELTDNADLNAEQKQDADEVLGMVLSEVKELDRITDQFMNLTRPAKMAWEPADINRVIERVLADCALVLEDADVVARPDLADGIPPLRLDVVRIRSAIYNLVQNAAQAMPDGGSLYVATRSEPDHVTVEIRDTGRGMSAETLDQMFDPYYTTRENEGGMGLGLTLARNAVLAHDGTIEARSRRGS